MSWLKPMMLMMVLGAILYGVYVVLNKGAAPEPPAGVAREWAKPPDIQLGVVDGERSGSRNAPGQPLDSTAAAAKTAETVYPWANSGPAAPPAADRTAIAPAPASSAYAPAPSPQTDPFKRDDAPAGNSGAAAAPLFSASPDAVAGKTGGGPDAAADSFSRAFESAKTLLAEGKLVEALRKLTKWHDNPQLSAAESLQLADLLSQLAGTVVYSRQHLLQPAYKVQAGDRLDAIAAKYNVPPQLLAKINGIDDPNRLNPGDELKVVRGPFSAFVDLDKRQLTLIVEDCYAGRFNLLAVGDMARKLEGSFEVAEKLPNGPASGATTAPPNPIHHWVRLGTNGNSWIVGTSDVTSIHPSGLNLSSRDAEDVFDILSTGSRVVVRR